MERAHHKALAAAGCQSMQDLVVRYAGMLGRFAHIQTSYDMIGMVLAVIRRQTLALYCARVPRALPATASLHRARCVHTS
jgi:hypothetical protein